MNLSGSICLTDVKEEDIVTAKNGKKYINFFAGERKQVSEWGKTHYIKIATTKEQRDAGKEAYYIGDGKAFDFSSQSAGAKQPSAPAAPEDNDDDFPF